ncbi:hypothetical protein MtrunA17_Chr5g0431521 [Medicago truncatula]|uniref:Transmembrane protein n=1 Tax=Medicago truncatula TaxID=3880 RepID=A0A396HVU1_MEDTR|nr:hypothetical protein MtrunA17_Chr5g0431521 [Medicago truncatula]
MRPLRFLSLKTVKNHGITTDHPPSLHSCSSSLSLVSLIMLLSSLTTNHCFCAFSLSLSSSLSRVIAASFFLVSSVLFSFTIIFYVCCSS